jgi:iron-sulfur cluster assembly protein
MAITMTEAAARHVSRYLTRQGQGTGRALGCQDEQAAQGLAYKLEYVDESRA